jgi:thymidine kinase
LKTVIEISGKKDGLQHYCRDCHRRSVVGSQRNHREAFLKRLQRYNERKRNEDRRQVFDYLKTHPCVDCGEPDVIVLDFDHQRDKQYTISELIISNKQWEQILTEIEKCEVRCANCHRRKTAEKFGWKKFKWQAGGN